MTAEPIKSARGGANPPQQHPLHYCTVLQGTGPVGKQFLSILDLGLLKGTGSTCFKMCVVFFLSGTHVCLQVMCVFFQAKSPSLYPYTKQISTATFSFIWSSLSL